MSSFVSSILHNSANKIESMSMRGSRNNSKNQNRKSSPNLTSRLAVYGASTPTLSSPSYCYHPQMSYSAEYVPSVAPPPPPPYGSPTPTPSTSWTSEMSALAEKIKDDVTSSFKGKQQQLQQQQIDRHSISQGMKLVSIAADEYEDGNESVALDIYLTGVDKIIMALPNKTDNDTKLAIREKLASVEERVGIFNLSNAHKKQLQIDNAKPSNESSMVSSFILSRVASTISGITSRAYQSSSIVEITESETTVDKVHTTTSSVPLSSPSAIISDATADPMTRFKKLGQYLIELSVSCAIVIKQSPIPDIVTFLFGYLLQVLLWVDSQYHVAQKVQDFGIQCIKLGLQADEQYRLHEFVSEGIYMLIAAGLKAAVAFKETPRYEEQRHIQDTTCIPNQKTRSWIWSSQQ